MTEGFSTPTADVIVIGGGLIGCSIALRLAQAKLRVCVLDRGEPGAEASSAAAGMLAPQGETVDPDAFFELCAASRDLYPHYVAEIEELSGQDVGYRRDGALLVAIDDAECGALQRIYEAQSRQGLPIERLAPAEMHRRVPGLSPEIRDSSFVPGDHWLDNERLCDAVIAACRRLGVEIRPRHAVIRLNLQSGRVQDIDAMTAIGPTGKIKLSASHFVLAAGCWSGALAEPLGIKLPVQPCRGQMMEFDSPAELPLVVRAGHHYLVPRPGRRVLAGTTAEYVGFDKAVTAEGLRSILEGVERIAPFVKGLKFRRAWSGLRPDTADHLPILGHGEIVNLFLATGHFRNGILLLPQRYSARPHHGGDRRRLNFKRH
ncbi:MAG: glycine oxidase ThiO [Acidobacteriia bacterium]|nr:glycine oxidase ThiO [Terriglobia bacterium]